MPRLVGKTSNTAAYTTLGIIALALAVGTALEYEGIIDIIPGFGAAKVQTQQNRTDRTIAPAARTTN
jgi:hypothetical protein